MADLAPVTQPNISAPFFDSDGNMARSWWRFFNQLANRTVVTVEEVNTDLDGKVDKTTQVIAGTGMDGGGALSTDVTLDIADTGVVSGDYGDAITVPAFQVNAQGQLTLVTDTPIDFPVTSVFGRTGDVVAETSDYTAVQVDYDNSSSGLSATNVQAAIDEVQGNIPAIPVDSVFGRTGAVTAQAGDYDADQVDYDNSTSGLSATEVQAAIDELADYGLDDLSDVDLTGLMDGYILVYDSGTSTWQPEANVASSGLTQPQVLARISIGA